MERDLVKDSLAVQIESATRAGDVQALTRLGRQLLGGEGETFDPVRGAQLIEAAAGQGGAEAAAHMAVLCGAGVCRPQNWSEALDYLQLAAERGSTSAQGQLELLCADRELVAAYGGAGGRDPADWLRLREAVSIVDWLEPPERQVISESPRIRRMDGFLSSQVCGWLIETARGQLARARIYSTDGNGAAVANTRTNSETDFNIVQSDLVLVLVRARIAAATGLPPAVMELTKVLHYSVGERFDLHYDYIDPAVPGFAAELAARGQRLATFLVYLNDAYEGGQTHFPRVGLSHRGAAGSALFFANVDTSGRPDPSTLHAGLAPTHGEKWLLSQWIRDRSPAGR